MSVQEEEIVEADEPQHMSQSAAQEHADERHFRAKLQQQQHPPSSYDSQAKARDSWASQSTVHA